MRTRAKILAVDDDPINIAIVEELLVEDYELRTAATGEEAIEVAVDFHPDIILLDIMMPVMDGYEACRQLREHATLKHIKIIMVSAKASMSERLEGYKAGADDYLTKPFDGDELLAKIHVCLRMLDKSEEVEDDGGESDVCSEQHAETETERVNIDDVSDSDQPSRKEETLEASLSLSHFFSSARSLLSSRAHPIGIDIGDDALTLVQLESGREGVSLIHADRVLRPDNIEPQSSASQKWVAQTLRELIARGHFKGRHAVVALPSKDVFVDNMIISQTTEPTLQDTTFSRIVKRLPPTMSKEDAIIEYVSPNAKAFVVMATERTRVDRCLAICERAKIKLKSLSAWPMALTNCYSHLWAGHDDNPKMLVDIAGDCTNVAICRGAELYLARSIPLGARDLDIDRMTEQLASEIRLCNHFFAGAYQELFVNSLIFLSGHIRDRDIYRKIAENLGVSAQIADSFEAMQAPCPRSATMEKGVFPTNWTVAFGLSLVGQQSLDVRRSERTGIGW